MDKWEEWLERKDWMTGEIPTPKGIIPDQPVKADPLIGWIVGVILIIGIPTFMYWLSTN